MGSCVVEQDADSTREALRKYIQVVEEDMAGLLGAAKSKRTAARSGHRSGGCELTGS